MGAKVLIVDDEPTLREALQYNLTRQGYTVETADDGPTGLAKARQFKPELVVLDVMLPGMDGFEVCRVLRRESNVPILMLTARTDEIDKVVGLEVGADDYITKPFSTRELEARLRALLRRAHLARDEQPANGAIVSPDRLPSEPPLTFGDLTIDATRREALLGARVLDLKPKEFDLLLFLARNHGIVLSRELLLERVWGWQYVGATRTVDVHIRWLREKIEPEPANPQRIITIRGIGYRFEE